MSLVSRAVESFVLQDPGKRNPQLQFFTFTLKQAANGRFTESADGSFRSASSSV
ncbi:hypothetical protein EV567_2098 [Streptomyces sp. BK239]|nr:hypothetical protein EV567_2098 [Streptomyces sp. BK239]